MPAGAPRTNGLILDGLVILSENGGDVENLDSAGQSLDIALVHRIHGGLGRRVAGCIRGEHLVEGAVHPVDHGLQAAEVGRQNPATSPQIAW